MSSRDADGHIVNLCSVTGHGVAANPELRPIASAYYASKFAVNALNRVINRGAGLLPKEQDPHLKHQPRFGGGTNIAKDT